MLESWPSVMVMMILNGIKSPVYSAAFGLIWTIGRVIYMMGYSVSPKGRIYGGLTAHLGDWPLTVLTIWNGLSLLNIL